MNRNYDSSSRESRSELRGKRRKTNLVLNMLIGLVILLIIFVSVKIFFGGNDENAAEKEQKIESKQDEKDIDTEENKNSAIDENKDEKQTESETENTDESEENSADTEADDEIDPIPANEEEEVVTEGGSNGNVKKTIENPSWNPIGTTQTGEHYAVYDKESVDWAEMLQAISYATGVDQSNMNVWFLGNNGFNKSVGTITTKDQKQIYRVYIDWVDGQGWKPTKVEELNKVEKK
ncbi:YrrS family protein [Cytobacillus solani]|uniref:DNA primase n=1 Tax=Cytobacillus solani TaxID=1637975 RepID=A0A0Q3VJ42_9BACI|nr:YrrS family protein [Cytobacillus solani]KQL20611.1 DNA primase [Cytobacillus solani]